MFRCLTILVIFVGAINAALHHKPHLVVSDEFISETNKKATTWKAGRNFDASTPLEELKKRLNLWPRERFDSEDSAFKQVDIPDDYDFPENFDSRLAWPECPSISEVRDQGSCGSCWALSAAEVMTDRTCIHSDGKVNFHYSAQDIVGCCYNCGDSCKGGNAKFAFKYWAIQGFVSGGPFGSSEGCKPYLITNDGKNHWPVRCHRECQSNYNITYEEDLHFGQEGQYRINHDIKSIKYELLENGPVTGDMRVYEDFFNYKEGVYQYVHGHFVGDHTIKIIGYGVDDGVPYWLCTNSWNETWGDKGFFKIFQHVPDKYQIVYYVNSALPKFQ